MEKKVPQRKDIGVITKFENLAMSACEFINKPARKPPAENTKQFRITMTAKYKVNFGPTPKIVTINMIRKPEYKP